MKKINILIFEPYPFNSEGGNQRTLNYFLEHVDKERFHFILLSPFETEFVNRLRKRGVDCLVVEPSDRINQYGGKNLNANIFNRFLSVMDLVFYNLKIINVLRKKKIDIVYSNCIRAVLTIGLAARLTRTPNLLYVKGELDNKFLDPVSFFLSNKILFFCNSNKHDKYPRLIKFLNKKIGILKIGLDPDTIETVENSNKKKLKNELSINADNINIIILGQLYPLKGVHILLKAVARIIEQFPQIRLYIVGDQVIDEYREYKATLDGIIKKHKMEKNIIFTGWRKDAHEILSCMDILVHPSFSEGFGRAVLEAMAFGKPVIASRVGGLREIIEDGENGFLIEVGNDKMIADRISILIRDETLRVKFQRNAQKTVFSEYLIQDKICELETIFQEMVQKKL